MSVIYTWIGIWALLDPVAGALDLGWPSFSVAIGLSVISEIGYSEIAGIYGGEADAILDGKTGYLCDGNDLNALYETLLKILNNDQYKKFGANALEFSKNFNWNKIVKKYIELI